MHSLAIPATAGWSATGEGPAAAFAAAFALSADRSVPKGPAPARHALSAGAKLSEARGARWPYGALTAALVCHLALLALTAPRLQAALWPAPPHPIHEDFGLEDGSVEVAVVSAADLDRLHTDHMRREAVPSDQPPSDTPPAPPPEPPPVPQQQQVQEQADPYFTPSQSKGVKTEAYDPSGFAEMAAAQFSMQVDNAYKLAQARRQQQQQPARQVSARAEVRSGSVAALRPGASHKGRSDEFAKDVVWALDATKPMGNGKYGSVIVTFTVNDAGKLEGLRLIKSAGDPWLDQAVLMSVRQARMPKPPEPLPAGDRTFNVHYISQEGR
jgi:periplasmic protein TonB